MITDKDGTELPEGAEESEASSVPAQTGETGGDSEISPVADGPGADDGDADETPEPDAEEERGHMTLLEHLGELRVRLTRCTLFIIVGFFPGYYFAEQIFDILMDPMKEVLRKVAESHQVLPLDFFTNLRDSLAQSLKGTDFKYFDQLDFFVRALQDSMSTVMVGGHFQYTSPTEAFFAHMKIAIVGSIFLMSPFIFTQIWGFIAPGLYKEERRWVVPTALVSAAFFISGGLFGYFIVFPLGFEFFASFANADIAFTPKLDEYLSFCLKMLFAFGMAFELPLFILVLARIGLVTSRKLRKFQQYAVLIIFIVAAILTPPDPASQVMMAAPLLLLYEMGIWLAYFFGKNEKKNRKAAKEAAKAAAKEAADSSS